MGKNSNTLNYYFSDEKRFADLFNGVFSQGKPVVEAQELSEASEVYHQPEAEKPKTGVRGKRVERIHDICKKLKTGSMLRILTLENQLCKALHNDGEEKWDGPRSLGDMMNFAGIEDKFRELFNDYPLRLYCLNEAENLELFHTEVAQLFRALQYRSDRAGLRRLLESDPGYHHLDRDTLEAMAVLLKLPSVWEKRKNIMHKNQEREEFDMCQAVREWAEEERKIGREEGLVTIVRNLIRRGVTDEDIVQIVECDGEYVAKVRAAM